MNDDKRFYVYFHKRKDTGEVFYIGKGSGQRLKRPRIYKEWLRVNNEAGGFTYEIYRNGLTEKEAISLETKLISENKCNWPLVNKRKPIRVIDLNIEEIRKMFYYDESSPTCLRWKVWNKSKIKKTSRDSGDIAGYLTGSDRSKYYYSVRVLGKTRLVHRVIWTLFHGDIPDGFVVNHIDNNSLNNTINNLELVTQRENCHKTVKQNKEDAGIYRMETDGYWYWVASWVDMGGKRKSVLMSCTKLGEYEAYLAAKERRRIELIKLNEQGASYLIN